MFTATPTGGVSLDMKAAFDIESPLMFDWTDTGMGPGEYFIAHVWIYEDTYLGHTVTGKQVDLKFRLPSRSAASCTAAQ